ncbi:MAG TPA: hypothetical protein VGE25_08890 [Sediminibacterium sp.]
MASFFSDRTRLVEQYFRDWHNKFAAVGKAGDGRSRYCRLFDVFEERERRDLASPTDDKGNIITFHNCIGCNFEEGCLNILDFVEQFSGTEKVRTYLTIYTLLFYTLAERMGVIYKELNLVDNKGEFDWIRFPVLRRIKHWANFFKHPKSYMFLHHPDYFLENDPDRPNFLVEGEVNSAFVDSFYKAGGKNAELRTLVKNKKDWKVIFPDLLVFTQELCAELDGACDYVMQPDNIETLRPFTLRDY